MIHLRRSPLCLLALALLGCGRGPGNGHGGPSSSSSAVPPPAASSATTPTSGASSAPVASAAPVVPLDPPAPAPLTSSWVGAKTEKACKAQTVELAGYQQKGMLSLGGKAEGVAATWRARIGGKPQDQVAFASYDAEGHKVASPRGVGLTMAEAAPRVFGSGPEWTVVWFDEKGLAYARPHQEQLPLPEVSHLGAIGPDAAPDVALASTPGGAVLATTPSGEGRTKLGLFLFSGPDGGGIKALGVTHSGKEPRRSAAAAGASSTFVVWEEGGALVGARFDAAGKESGAGCTIAPASGEKRERLAVATTSSGAVAAWMEGDKVRTRALDASGCPSSPIWTAGEGRWAGITSLGDSALVVWVGSDGRLLAARLQPNGAPPEKGLDAAEGTTGVKDPPSVVGFGAGKVAFGWAEPMSPVVSTKRLALRIVDAGCIP